MKFKNWIKDLLSGAAIGFSMSVPGVSGGTMAVILGIYQKVIDSLSNILKHFLKSILTLLPIGLGIVIAMVPCIFLFNWAFDHFVFGIVSLFAGLIIGSFPGVLDEVKGEKITKGCIVALILAIILTIGLGVASVYFDNIFDIESHMQNPEPWFYPILIGAGILSSTALVVPGVSGSMLLLVLGFYAPLLQVEEDLIKHMFQEGFWQNLLLVGCFAVGCLIGIVLISKLMNYLLKRHHTITFFAIIGFIVGSTITLYFNTEIYGYYKIWTTEGMPWWAEVIIAVVLFVGALVITYKLVQYKRHKDKLALETTAAQIVDGTPKLEENQQEQAEQKEEEKITE